MKSVPTRLEKQLTGNDDLLAVLGVDPLPIDKTLEFDQGWVLQPELQPALNMIPNQRSILHTTAACVLAILWRYVVLR